MQIVSDFDPGRMTALAGTPRIPAIDGLRALAILIVMVSHAGLGWIIPGGFGVTIFFFLSGYLITTLLRLEHQRSGSISLPAFYARRAVRILPPLWLTMALVAVLIATQLLAGAVSARGTVIDLLFLTNYGQALGVPSTTPIPLWSLDVEEHFYLVFPALFMLLAKIDGQRTAGVLLILCVAVLLVRFATFPGDGRVNIYYWSHTRIDSILWGAILAVWQNPVLDRNAWQPGRWHVAAAAAAILLTFAIRNPLFRETFRYTLQGAALFILFSAAIQARGLSLRVLDGQALKLVATLSYTLYLIHLPMLRMCEERMPMPVAVAVAVTLSFAWAGLVHIWVEAPLARWRRRSITKVLAGRVTVPTTGRA